MNRTPILKDPSDWTRDDWVLLLIAMVGLGVFVRQRHKLGALLQRHQIVLAEGQGLLTIPAIGDLDVSRIIALVAAVLLAIVLGRRLRRRARRAQGEAVVDDS